MFSTVLQKNCALGTLLLFLTGDHNRKGKGAEYLLLPPLTKSHLSNNRFLLFYLSSASVRKLQVTVG